MDSSCLHIPAGWNLWLRIYKTLHINPSILLINKRVLWHYNNRHDNTSSHRSEIILKGTTHLQNTLLWFNRERENRRKLSMKTTFNQRVFSGDGDQSLHFLLQGKSSTKRASGLPNVIHLVRAWTWTGAPVSWLFMESSPHCTTLWASWPLFCALSSLLWQRNRRWKRKWKECALSPVVSKEEARHIKWVWEGSCKMFMNH